MQDDEKVIISNCFSKLLQTEYFLQKVFSKTILVFSSKKLRYYVPTFVGVAKQLVHVYLYSLWKLNLAKDSGE